MSSTSGSASASVSSDKLTIDIRPLLEDVSQVMTKHITSILSGVVGEYTVYKETHETIMGLPCVRKLQDRISELENQLNGGDPASSAPAYAHPTEISELQSAIVDLNRYIKVLESRESQQQLHEDAIRLEVQEHDDVSSSSNEPDVIIPPSVHVNRIIESSSVTYEDAEDAEETEDADVEETEESEVEEPAATEEGAAEPNESEEEETEETTEETTEDAEQEETEDAEVDDAEVDDAEVDDAEVEDAEVEETEDAEVEETEDAEVEDAEVEETEATAEEGAEDAEEEIEVSEIKIKGVTYFTTSAQNGIIYACVDDDVGDEVGVFKNGVALFKNKTAKK
jgi:hypothetical protein